MRDNLFDKAKRLAEKPYAVEVKREPGDLSPDIPRYSASVQELPFCVAQGFTEEEALREVRSVMVDYILSLLARDMPVPKPESEAGAVEPDYATRWVWDGCFVYAEKGLLEKLTAPAAGV